MQIKPKTFIHKNAKKLANYENWFKGKTHFLCAFDASSPNLQIFRSLVPNYHLSRVTLYFIHQDVETFPNTHISKTNRQLVRLCGKLLS